MYEINEFVDFLSEKNGETYEDRYKQLVIRLGDQRNTFMLNAFLYYLSSDTSGALAEEINKIDDDKAMRCVETLLMLYPMSGNILSKIDKKLFQGIELNDVLKNIWNFVNGLGNLIRNDNTDLRGFKRSVEHLEEDIKKNKEKIEVQKKEKEQYEALCAQNKDLVDEISRLENEIEQLKSNSIEEQLRKKEEELRKQRDDLKRADKSVAERLKKVEEELSSERSTKSNKIDKALEAFRKTMSELPDDLSDRFGR